MNSLQNKFSDLISNIIVPCDVIEKSIQSEHSSVYSIAEFTDEELDILFPSNTDIKPEAEHKDILKKAVRFNIDAPTQQISFACKIPLIKLMIYINTLHLPEDQDMIIEINGHDIPHDGAVHLIQQTITNCFHSENRHARPNFTKKIETLHNMDLSRTATALMEYTLSTEHILKDTFENAADLIQKTAYPLTSEEIDKFIKNCGVHPSDFCFDKSLMDMNYDDPDKEICPNDYPQLQLRYGIRIGLDSMDLDEWYAIQNVFHTTFSWTDASSLIQAMYFYDNATPLDYA